MRMMLNNDSVLKWRQDASMFLFHSSRYHGKKK